MFERVSWAADSRGASLDGVPDASEVLWCDSLVCEGARAPLGPKEGLIPVAELADMGVRRISVGGALANVAVDAVIKAGRELMDAGSFGFLSGLTPASEIAALMTGNTDD